MYVCLKKERLYFEMNIYIEIIVDVYFVYIFLNVLIKNKINGFFLNFF